jgi:hypothetical protein
MDKQKIRSIILRYIVEHKKLPLTRDEIDYVREQSDRVLFSGKNPVFEQYSFSTIIRKFSEVMIDRIQADRSDRSGYNRTAYDLSDYNKKVLTEDDYLVPSQSTAIIERTTEDEKKNKLMESPGVKITDFLGISTYDDFMRFIVPEKYYKKHYIILDSKSRNRSNPDTNVLTWDYAPNKQNTNNVVTSNGIISDIISMKLFQIIMPQDIANIDVQYRISILIKEFETQSSIVSENVKYHFVGRYVVPLGLSLNSKIYFDDNKYDFYTPFKYVNTFTIQFKLPDIPISLNKDILPASITYGSPTILTMDENHHSVTGHTIYIEDFTTDAPATDKNIIQFMNRPEGHYFSKIDQFTGSINVNTSAVTPKAGLLVSVYLGSQRIIIPIEFTCLS